MQHPHAADVLANERTFLAYARTALAFIAFGFVIARFALFTREVAAVAHIKEGAPAISTGFGIVMAIAGAACAVFGAYRYVVEAHALRRDGVASMSDAAAYTLAGAIGAIGLIVMWTLFAVV